MDYVHLNIQNFTFSIFSYSLDKVAASVIKVLNYCCGHGFVAFFDIADKMCLVRPQLQSRTVFKILVLLIDVFFLKYFLISNICFFFFGA